MTIGSLLQGMSEEERGKIDLKVLIAHVDPRLHPAVHEPWLRNAVDHVVLYNESLSSGEIEYLLELEMNEERQEEKMNEKEVFDYVYILKQCFESGSEYIAILEDDVLACDGWLHRSLAALREAEERSYRRSEKGDGCKWLHPSYASESTDSPSPLPQPLLYREISGLETRRSGRARFVVNVRHRLRGSNSSRDPDVEAEVDNRTQCNRISRLLDLQHRSAVSVGPLLLQRPIEYAAAPSRDCPD